ncbi:tRNA (cytosine(34)-C(5))-methyltransferase isoform X2 [Cimex lectularius]|uniref:tRNA (cytosine(34)-C(5))-methyltransferase n=1 Tax=Cimex lectularius TaxID=79782 RepID=A0A8I6TIJ3_CIMLE|nr:tRNA (cytosine(34)-C(5))-methyltransferase isoform X2 [Cimex lectularius]
MGGGTRRFKRKFKKKTVKKGEMQKIVPDEEWDTFLSYMKKDLPTAFRITACSKEEARLLLKIVQGDLFASLLEAEGCRADLKCLPWYPDSLGWQLTISRKDIRRSEMYFRLHNFLMAETATGNISRQETVSMIPPLILDVKPHHKVLDMCAAPGSKTAQLIEKLHENDPVPDGLVIANDVDNSRCYMLVHQAKRLNSPCCIITNHDASNMPNFMEKAEDGTERPVKFDRVLCDVPCSGDGTLRKNADIWVKWNINNANSLHGVQYRILKRGVEMLAVNGRLVYSTCSLNPVEDEAVIQRILHKAKGALELVGVSGLVEGLKYRPGLRRWSPASKDQERILEKIGLDNDVDYKLEKCLRILPHDGDTGGFFVAVVHKLSALPWEAQPRVDDDLSTGDKPNFKKEKRRRILGYREDPFVFFKGDEEVWHSIREFYKIEDLEPTCLLTRCLVGKKKNIYFTSKSVRDLVDHNQTKIKIINTGVKVFARCDNRSMQCQFRLVQEGLFRIKQYVKGRRVVVPDEDILKLLQNFDPHNPTDLSILTEETKSGVEGISQGSCVIDCKGLSTSFVGWRGNKSLRVYISRPEAIHYLRLLGFDVSIYDVNKFKKEVKEDTKDPDAVEEDKTLTDGQDELNKQPTPDGELQNPYEKLDPVVEKKDIEVAA